MPFFDSQYRKIVQELNRQIFRVPGAPTRYRTEGISESTFKTSLLTSVVVRGLWPDISADPPTLTTVDEITRLDFLISGCIEKGFIRRGAAGDLRIGYDGARLISRYYYLDKLNGTLIIALLSLVVSIVVACATARQVDILATQTENSSSLQSATFMIEFNDQLRNGPSSFSGLMDAIDRDRPLLKPMGAYSTVTLDNYLMVWETLDNVYQEGLISKEMVYDAFSYDLVKAYCNPEIHRYIEKVKTQDGITANYGGFTELAEDFLEQDHSSCK